MTGRLTGTYLKSDGNPNGGTVTLTPSVPRVIDVGGNAIITGTYSGRLLRGKFDAVLPAYDDAGLNPTGVTWTVSVELDEGEVPDVIGVQVLDGETIDMADISDPEPDAPVYALTPGPAGPQGPAGPAGPQGPIGPDGDQGIRGNRWWSESGEPQDGTEAWDLAIVGDYWLDVETGNYWEKLTDEPDGWDPAPSTGSLIGPVGPQGEPGADGADSDTYDTGLRDITGFVAASADPDARILARRWAAGAQDLVSIRFIDPNFGGYGAFEGVPLPVGWRPLGNTTAQGVDPEDASTGEAYLVVLRKDGILQRPVPNFDAEFLFAATGERPAPPFGTAFVG